jgi:predicted metal-dependent HD superfamily phosphohydrolase
VLQRFLAAPVIFPDPDFRARLEATARENMARELASLS